MTGRNKKIVVVIAGCLAVAAIALYVVWTRQSEPSEAPPPPYPIVFREDGLGLLYNKERMAIERFDPTSGLSDELIRLEEGPIGFELSADQRKLLLSLADDDELSEAETLKIVSLGDKSVILEKDNIFSPAWLNNDEIIYQKLPPEGTGELAVFSLKENRETKIVQIANADLVVIKKLDDGNVIAYDYSSDVGEVEAWRIALDTEKSSFFAKADGLMIKTRPPSDYVLATEVDLNSNKPTTKIIRWQDGGEIARFSCWLQGIDCGSGGALCFVVENQQLFRFDVPTKSKTPIKKLDSQIINLKILEQNKRLYLETLNASETIEYVP